MGRRRPRKEAGEQGPKSKPGREAKGGRALLRKVPKLRKIKGGRGR